MDVHATPLQVVPLPNGAARGAPIPWWAKMGLKIVLARVALPYKVWRRLGIFRHGSSEAQILTANASLSDAIALHASYGSGAVRNVLELGPGDSLALAVAAKARNIAASFVDVGDFAGYDADAYRALSRQFGKAGEDAFANADFSTREKMLNSCGATYATRGLESLKKIQSDSIDMSLSTVVLEHVRAAEFDEMLRELFRVTRSGGTGRHIVDVMDHLGGALNNLRFPKQLWESRFMARSGFYTNRLRPREILERARQTGFDAAIVNVQKFQKPAITRAQLAREFRTLPDSDFDVAVFELVLRKS